MTKQQLWLTVAVIALVTALIRFFPFLVFSNGKSTPRIVEKLGKLLPSAVMAMLVIYCLKDVSFASPSDYLPPIDRFGNRLLFLYLEEEHTAEHHQRHTLLYDFGADGVLIKTGHPKGCPVLSLFPKSNCRARLGPYFLFHRKEKEETSRWMSLLFGGRGGT